MARSHAGAGQFTGDWLLRLIEELKAAEEAGLNSLGLEPGQAGIVPEAETLNQDHLTPVAGNAA